MSGPWKDRTPPGGVGGGWKQGQSSGYTWPYAWILTKCTLSSRGLIEKKKQPTKNSEVC